MFMHIVQDIKLSDETNKASSIFFFTLEKTHYKFLNIDDILLCLELIDWKKQKKKKKRFFIEKN